VHHIKMLGVAIVGTGWGTRIQIPAFRQAGMNVNAIWARNKDKAEQLAKENNVSFGTSDITHIMQRDDVHLVSIVTPPNTHCEFLQAALKAGKHVLCEKPTALNAKEAEMMLKASQEHPKQICILDHELRFLPSMLKAKEIAQEKCGGIFFVEAIFQTGSRLGPKDWNWWFSKEHGGGALGAVGSHLIDALCYITNQKVESVCGVLGTFVKERKDPSSSGMIAVTADDYSTAQLKMTGGIMGTLQAIVVKAGPAVHKISFSGPKGTLCIDGPKLTFIAASSSSTDIQSEVLQDDDTLLDKSGPLKDIWALGTLLIGKALKSAIVDGNKDALKNSASLEDALHIQKVIDAIHESNASGKWVNIK